MDEQYQLTRIGPEQIGQHYYLDASDRCYCLGPYYPKEGPRGRGLNQIVFNLKKKPTWRSHADVWRYKGEAIARIASVFAVSSGELFPDRKITLIPVPPSKKIGDPDYDDRMLQVCNQMAAGPASLEVLELFSTKQSVQASHLSGKRPTKEQLKENIRLHIGEPDYRPAPLVLLLDDVLASGAHYSACRELLEGLFPAVTVVGFFVARASYDEQA